MVRFKPEKEKKAWDWDRGFKAVLVATIIISAVLLVVNYFEQLTEYPLIMFFSLPAAWAVIGQVLAHKYSSAEQRDMHKVSDFGVLSLCGYFAAFFLVLYGLKTKEIITFMLAVIVFFVFYGYSWKVFKAYMVQRNIHFEWGMAKIILLLLFLLAVITGLLSQMWDQLWALVLLVAGVIYLFKQFWGKLTKAFWYAQRYRAFIVFGLVFSFLSLVLWTFVFVVVGVMMWGV
ncbi:hypothetical protein HZC30_02610 [Candidatus Woesearchaeota archaeon]|nr:hypothetical protein [Candidatus Woesearchaeota archaeon]